MMQGRCGKHGGARWLWLVLALWLVAWAAQASGVTVRAWLGSDHVQLGDSVTLNVEVDGTTQAQAPDVGALASDFDILGTSRNTSLSIINGQRSVKSTWAIELKPRHAGTLIIPALTVDGQATRPLTLTVGSAPATTRSGPGGPVFLRVKPSTSAPYVGQQIDLDVKLFYAPGVDSGSIHVPHAKGVEVRSLGKGTNYQAQRGGRIYNVLEKHYAVTVQRAGPLNLSPVVFNGTMTAPGRFAGFFGNDRSIAARSKPIHLAIRSRPASFGKGTWLPARKLTVQLTGLPSDGHVMAGQALTLTLTEKAVGLPFESLPKPRLPKLKGVDVYPDQTQDHTGNNGHWLEGTRTRKFAVVPQKAGTLTIPAITLAWWNVKTGHKEVARIPAHTLTVAAATAMGASSPVAPALPATSGPARATSATSPAVSAGRRPKVRQPAPAMTVTAGSSHWPAWLALGLWVLTMLVAAGIWWSKRRRRVVPTVPSSVKPSGTAPVSGRRLHRVFLEAARGGDVATQCDSLLAWAHAERPSLRNLGDLATALDSPAQRAAIAGLQRARYADAGGGPDGDALSAAFRGGLAWRDETSPVDADSALPPLYP